ncbi:MAG: calcium-binding protein, partial [Cyanobacteria bacterium P01_A01_bin.40]
QRGEGFDRTVGNGTDIGAFEVQTISNEDIIGTEGRDFLQGTNESDRIFGLDGTDFIQGLDGDDLIDGGSGGDRLLGGAGDDTITDGSGNDIVFGNEGDDIFIASNAGDDLFSGGAGKDIYVYDLNANADGFERARIIDFEPEQDLIAFRPLVSDMATLAEFADLDTDGSGVLDSEDERINIRGVSTTIDFSDLFGHDANSDTITLIGATSLNESNFLFNETVVGTEFG